jgi:hypothetical protein
MFSFISSSDRTFIRTLLLWIAGFALAANILAGYGLDHWPWLQQRQEMPRFQVAASIEDYLLDYPECPIVVLGSSVSEALPPVGWERADVCTLALVGEGSFLGLEIMVRTPAAPRVLFIESTFGFRDVSAKLLAAATDPVFREIHAWFPLSRAKANWINALWKSRYPRFSLLWRPTQPWSEWRAERRSFMDVYRSMEGGAVNEWQRNHLDGTLRRTAELVAEMERRGSKIIFFEAPLDRYLASMPVVALWTGKMHEAFADHEWVMDSPEKYYLVDGEHFTSGSGKDFFDLLMTHLTGDLPQSRDRGNDGR